METPDSVFVEWFGMSRATLVDRLRRLADDLENVDRCAEAQAPGVAMNSWALGTRTVPCLVGRTLGHPTIFDGKPA